MTTLQPASTPTLAEIRSEMRWRKACPALLTVASLFGVVAPLLKPVDLDDVWADHLAPHGPAQP